MPWKKYRNSLTATSTQTRQLLIKLLLPLSLLKGLALPFYEPRIMRKHRQQKLAKLLECFFKCMEYHSLEKAKLDFFLCRVTKKLYFSFSKIQSTQIHRSTYFLNYWRLFQKNCQDVGLNYYLTSVMNLCLKSLKKYPQKTSSGSTGTL